MVFKAFAPARFQIGGRGGEARGHQNLFLLKIEDLPCPSRHRSNAPPLQAHSPGMMRRPGGLGWPFWPTRQ